jgi:N-acetylmuramoyl-L-alanine amidase
VTPDPSKLVAVVALGAVLAAGCAVGQRPVLTDEGIQDVPDGGAAADTGVVTDPTVDLPGPEALGEVPPVLVSPSGVVVPVVERTATGYLVRTPCGNEAELLWGQPLRSAQVVLDAGHGGDERGAIGPSGEAEAELNLDITRRTATALETQGVTVVLTRTADYRIPINNRAAIADQLSAEVFVSVHHNSPSAAPSDQPGTEVYVQAGSDASRRLGGLVHEEIIGTLSSFEAEWVSRTDAGVLTVVNEDGEDAYGINRYPTTPAVLAELAYLSNPSEAAVLATPEYRQAAADALARAIIRYLRTDDPGSGFVDAPRLSGPAGGTGGTDGCADPVLG